MGLTLNVGKCELFCHPNASIESPIVIFQKFNDFKQVSQFVMVALEFEGFARSHFPPFWLQRQDPFPSKTPSSRRLTQNHADSYFALYMPRWIAAVGGPPPDRPLSGKQSFYRIGQVSFPTKQQLNPICRRNTEKASFLAPSAPHSGDWLLSLPITACGLRLEDDAVRTAVALRLGVNLRVPHVCHCGAQVDAFGVHSLICKHAACSICNSRYSSYERADRIVHQG